MRKLFTTVAAAAMMLGATAAYAQNATTEYYVVTDGDAMMVMGGDNTEGVVVLGDETYAVPADCPEGSFYRSGENTLTACGEGGASFEIAEPASGATLSSGDAFPEGARILTPRDNGDNRQDTSGGTNTGSGGSTTGSSSGNSDPAAGPGATGQSGGSTTPAGPGSTGTTTTPQ